MRILTEKTVEIFDSETLIKFCIENPYAIAGPPESVTVYLLMVIYREVCFNEYF
jgi:hypothetical protein